MTRVIVCGGRDYGNYDRAFQVLDDLHSRQPIDIVFHGNCRGADLVADAWARSRRVTVHPCPADWKRHGHRAGPIRNQNMLGHKPDVVVAFPGGRGTADMVRRARAANVDVIEVTKGGEPYDL